MRTCRCLCSSSFYRLPVPFVGTVPGQIHRIVKKPGNLDVLANAVDEQVSSLLAALCDVIRPRIGVNVAAAFASLGVCGKRPHGDAGQLEVFEVLALAKAFERVGVSSRASSSSPRRPGAACTLTICASARGERTAAGTTWQSVQRRASARQRQSSPCARPLFRICLRPGQARQNPRLPRCGHTPAIPSRPRLAHGEPPRSRSIRPRRLDSARPRLLPARSARQVPANRQSRCRSMTELRVITREL